MILTNGGRWEAWALCPGTARRGRDDLGDQCCYGGGRQGRRRYDEHSSSTVTSQRTVGKIIELHKEQETVSLRNGQACRPTGRAVPATSHGSSLWPCSEGMAYSRNSLNHLAAREWIVETISVWNQRGESAHAARERRGKTAGTIRRAPAVGMTWAYRTAIVYERRANCCTGDGMPTEPACVFGDLL